MNTLETLPKKIEALREQYKTAPLKDRKLIEIRGKLYVRALEALERKNGRKLFA